MVVKRGIYTKSRRLAELKKHGFHRLFLVAGLLNDLNGVQARYQSIQNWPGLQWAAAKIPTSMASAGMWPNIRSICPLVD
jgi:hypothetical protein